MHDGIQLRRNGLNFSPTVYGVLLDPHQCRGLVRWHMDRAMLQDHLSATERRLTEAERNVASQRELVAQR